MITSDLPCNWPRTFSTPSREFSFDCSSSWTKSALSAGRANVIAIISVRGHGEGEAANSPIRTWRIVRFSAEGAGSGRGEYSGGANGARARRNSSARLEGKSTMTVTPLPSGGAFAADPPFCCASWITLSATRFTSVGEAGKRISSAIVGNGSEVSAVRASDDASCWRVASSLSLSSPVPFLFPMIKTMPMRTLSRTSAANAVMKAGGRSASQAPGYPDLLARARLRENRAHGDAHFCARWRAHVASWGSAANCSSKADRSSGSNFPSR